MFALRNDYTLMAQLLIDAGLFSVMNYVHQSDRLDLIGYGLASRDQVKSVMLFSKEGWRDLEGKRIGIIDDTATYNSGEAHMFLAGLSGTF